MRWYVAICGLIFLAGNAIRVVRVWRMPAHLRWDLYPMPKGTPAQRAYGGSYFEETEWWTKPAHHSRFAEFSYIAREVLAFHTMWKRNRPLWLRSWLMHVGLYGLVAAALLTFIAAATDAAWAELIRWTVLGGAAAGMAGTLGLLIVRARGRLPFSSRHEYFNLIAIFAVCVTALEAFSFAATPGELIAFSRAFLSTGPVPTLSSAVAFHLVVLGAFFAYFPATHMTHAYMKFFAFHRVRWDDAPLVQDAGLAAAIARNLERPVSWSAPHIAGSGATWSEIVARGKGEARP
jgi:hypothetical protein